MSQVASDKRAPPTLDTYRTSGTDGMATTARCPREGVIFLYTKAGRRVAMETTCKTWRCLGCRDRLKSLFKARVEYGISHLETCVFITFTYKTGMPSGVRARSVQREWRALLRRWKVHPHWKGAEWLRVMELTKKRVPHHHLVVGWRSSALHSEKVRCYGRVFNVRSFTRVWHTCKCLSHTLSRMWYEVTGDSWIVHAVPVVGARAGASYMAKYLYKGFETRDTEALGMERRWSSSRGFPYGGRLRLAQTENGGWDRKWFVGRRHWSIEIGGPDDLMERVGDLEVLAITRKRKLDGLAMEALRSVR